MDYKCKDKFLVQSVEVDESVVKNIADPKDIWSAAEANKVGDVQEQKLKVVFLAEVEKKAVVSTEDQPPTYEEPAAVEASKPVEQTPKPTPAPIVEPKPVEQQKKKNPVETKQDASRDEIKRLETLVNKYKEQQKQQQQTLIIVAFVVGLLSFFFGKLLK